MLILVTGASGSLGKSLVPFLSAHGHTLTLAGRSKAKLDSLYPGYRNIDYSQLTKSISTTDAIIHLAAANNDSGSTPEQYEQANVEFTQNIADATTAANRNIRLIHFSTFKVLDSNSYEPYQESKHKAEQIAKSSKDISWSILRIAPVYGSNTRGRLRHLSRFHPVLKKNALILLRAFKPIVSVERVCAATLDALKSNEDSIVHVADDCNTNALYTTTKRTMDLCISCVLILTLSPIMLILGLLVKIDSPGPALFAQKRLGANRKPFVLYKYRTMLVGTKQIGTHLVNSNRVTRLGRVLRKYKLDELPQLLNVIRNEMSFVGPRPCLPSQTNLVERRIQQHIFDIKPGITGLAQVRGAAMDDPQTLTELDSEYKIRQSIPLDISLIASTAIGRGRGDQLTATTRPK